MGVGFADAGSNFFNGTGAAHTSNRDDWETPQSLFDELNATYQFTLDPCSTHENAKCTMHYTIDDDGLSQSWAGHRCFVNPPYSRRMKEWIMKCAKEYESGAMIAALVPARTDTAWFWDYVVPYAKRQVHTWSSQVRAARNASTIVAVSINACVLWVA